MPDPISIPPKKREGREGGEMPEGVTLIFGVINPKYRGMATFIAGLTALALVGLAFQSRFDAHILAVATPLMEAHAAAEEKITTAITVVTDDHARQIADAKTQREAEMKEIRDMHDSVLILVNHDNDRVRRGR